MIGDLSVANLSDSNNDENNFPSETAARNYGRRVDGRG